MSGDVEVICGEPAGSCRCGLAPGHEGSHVCAGTMCGGVWDGVIGEPSFQVLRWPGSAP